MMTYQDIARDPAIRTYISKADEALCALGFTEHSFPHASIVAKGAGYILDTLGYPEKDAELARIAGFMHDIGNIINRVDHSQSGAMIAFKLLSDLGFEPDEIATVVTAIGNHDEGNGAPVNHICAALILADKSDVRRSRVRNKDTIGFDIHDRVNYSTQKSTIQVDRERESIALKLTIDTKYSSVMSYFEIFLDRMLLCKKSADKLGYQFKLIVNHQILL